MSVGKSLLWATLAACLVALLIGGWLLMPRTWVMPVTYGFLVVFIWVDVFIWCFWLRK